MAVEDQFTNIRGNQQNLVGEKFDGQFSCAHDYAPKVRKPYTITKQRERWTCEEHKKFIEALKLHGRAWRRIEEYVGTKTAVQIRSHAQKFFSKVARDSNCSNQEPEEPIVIPPPRPKRKPVHPYPRKSANSPLKETSDPGQIRLLSPFSGLENRSPTSVLSADALGSGESNSPYSGLSPVSSTVRCDLTISEPYSICEESRSPASVRVAPNPETDEQNLLKLELFPGGGIFKVEELEKEETRQDLRLFGRTVLVTGSPKPSNPTSPTCRTPPEKNEGKPVQPLPRKLVGVEKPSGSWSWIQMPLVSHIKSDLEVQIVYKSKEDPKKEGSLTGPNYSEAETQRHACQGHNEVGLTPVSQFRISDRSAFAQLRATRCERQLRGLVPYKKRRTLEVETHSSTIGGEDGVELGIRLGL